MLIDLTDKTALVTGSTEGIGFAAAAGLARSGARVFLNGRGKDKVEAAVARLAEEIGAGEGRINGIVADLADAAGADALTGALADVDILVNNAGIFQPGDFFDTDDETWTLHWQVNVMSGIRLSRHYLKGMAARGWGRVIFLGSESAFNIPVEMIHYGVSKTADVALARGLAKRMAGTGVTVNSVLPGPTLSEGVAAMLKDEQARTGQSLEQAAAAFVQQHRPSSILQRAATVEEVANMIVYVASPQASATTGAALRVDGGVIDTIM
jgi:NAD(P)-dependent dehydrogenase (short-subunit alcohol dehydrogenase family)